MGIWHIIRAALCAGLIALPGVAGEASRRPVDGPEYLFFAFDNGVGRGSLSADEQAAILAEYGFDGIGYTGTSNIPPMLQALDKHGLKLFSTYVSLNVDPAAEGPPYEPGLPTAIKQLEGRGTIIWLHVHGGTPSSTALDEPAVEVIRGIADMAAAAGLRVALYPHVGFYVATVQDAVRLAEKVDRKNVGASLNLCHFLKLDDERNLETRLVEAMPHLFAVSINGSDRGKTTEMGWDRLIQTLDRGDFDVAGFLKMLEKLGYDGPIGLQCYGIKGDIRENLRRSIKAWRNMAAGQPS